MSRLASSRDVASYLGISLKTLYRLIRDGSLPACRVGRQIRLRWTDVERFIAGNEWSK